MDANHDTQQHAVVTGGGTAGHVHPGLALASELVERGWTVSWIGRKDSVEERLVRRAGLEFDSVPALPVVGRNPLAMLRGVCVGLAGAAAARRVLKRRRPRVVVGTGGYVSFPAVLAARIQRRPVLLFESNAVMGVANRVLARFADRVAWGQSGGEADRLITGIPVHNSFQLSTDRGDQGEAPKVLLLGGSQGSESLNRALPEALEQGAARGWPAVQVVHQCGARHLETTRRRYSKVEADAEVTVVEFIDDVAEQMAAADIVVSRAGAQTLAELAAVGTPVILVPLGAAGGHQASNARPLADAGAAWVLTEADPVRLGERLAELLATLFNDRGRLSEAARRMAALAVPGAATRLADAVEDMLEAA